MYGFDLHKEFNGKGNVGRGGVEMARGRTAESSLG